MLLNVPFDEQKKFQQQFDKLANRVKRGSLENPHNWAILVAGPEERQFFYAVYPYVDIDRELRNAMINDILDDAKAKESRGAICIGLDLNRPDLPYDVIGLRPNPNLFDNP